MQLNAESLDFQDNTFSLIVGAAILHHLLNPEKVFEKINRILKPGGCAIFFEPFENGMSIMGLIYQSIINDYRFILLRKHHKQYFKSYVSCWQSMKNTDKQDAFFHDKDDKWIFTKTYFKAIYEKYNFNAHLVYPITTSDKPFLAQAESHFSGNNINNLPKWIYEKIESYEAWFSVELKQDFLTEGVVIFKK
jgi:ubiquinone/menaquinone biosynthesis C-methylase UbiE